MKVLLKVLRTIATIIVFLFVALIMIALFGPNPMVDYKETADLTQVTARYEEAVRMSRAAFARAYVQDVQSENGPTPKTAAGWIQLFDPNNTAKAPGGGPAYIPDDVDGDAETGAIGIAFTVEGNVVIAKPAFRDLQAVSRTVTPDRSKADKM